MKISDSLEQLALYNLQKRTAAGQVDVTTEKLKRFNAILDMFADDSQERPTDTHLTSLLAAPVQSTPYGRMLQALSAQLAQDQTPASQTDLHPELPVSGSERVQGPAPAVELIPQPAENLSEKEQINRSVARASQKYNLPENLVKGVIRAESAFNPRAVSAAGAQGLMQLMPATARELGVTDAFDIDQNIDGGTRYLKQMLDRFDGNVARALAAYNAGPGTVVRFKGHVPYRETIAYVERVMKYSQIDAATT